MKICIEGTAEELSDVAELLAIGRTARHAAEAPKKQVVEVPRRIVRAEDDIPNRDREEGAQ
jgi:hypothetical protein